MIMTDDRLLSSALPWIERLVGIPVSSLGARPVPVFAPTRENADKGLCRDHTRRAGRTECSQNHVGHRSLGLDRQSSTGPRSGAVVPGDRLRCGFAGGGRQR